MDVSPKFSADNGGTFPPGTGLPPDPRFDKQSSGSTKGAANSGTEGHNGRNLNPKGTGGARGVDSSETQYFAEEFPRAHPGGEFPGGMTGRMPGAMPGEYPGYPPMYSAWNPDLGFGDYPPGLYDQLFEYYSNGAHPYSGRSDGKKTGSDASHPEKGARSKVTQRAGSGKGESKNPDNDDDLLRGDLDDFQAVHQSDSNRDSVDEFRASRMMRPRAYPNPNELMVRQAGAFGRPQLTLDFPWYFELIAVVITMLTISSLVRTFLLQPFYIPSASMQNTLMVNDSVLVAKTAPRYSPLNRGDIVVFRDTENWLQSGREGLVKKKAPNPVLGGIKRFMIFAGLAPEDAQGFVIKRVMGMGGDTVTCCDEDGLLNINGKAIDEDYTLNTGVASEVKFNVVVPKGSLWVMGDNRNHSADSRYHMDSPSGGFVSEKQVVGRAFVVVWPLEHMRFISPSCAFYNIPKPVLGDKDAFSSESNEVPPGRRG
ncbi:signal peptidase I [Mobiluncus mulieris]|uniref:signal peptidase I n=1 Tax=Mobiluncus mulieris TaxID=2052 RepID=UPI00242BE309|nr:signal peptidase I [Mobiluncus mulieris]